MIRIIAWCTILLSVLTPACGAVSGGPPAAPSADEGARKAASTALASLSRRAFDTGGCAAAEARVVPEATARAGTAPGDRCSILVARRPDRTWLVVVRSSLPSKSYGAQARVDVNPEGTGVTGIEYAR